MQRVHDNHNQKRFDHMSLKGSFYKRKLMSEDRVMGLASLGLSFYVWSAFPYLAPAYGKFLTTFTGASSLMYGFNKFSDHKTVNHIERIKEGANAGKIRVHIALSPLFSYSVVADAS